MVVATAVRVRNSKVSLCCKKMFHFTPKRHTPNNKYFNSSNKALVPFFPVFSTSIFVIRVYYKTPVSNAQNGNASSFFFFAFFRLYYLHFSTASSNETKCIFGTDCVSKPRLKKACGLSQYVPISIRSHVHILPGIFLSLSLSLSKSRNESSAILS